MTIDAAEAGTPPDLPRAGFWRRWLALLIDTIIVALPFQMLAAVLFAMTAGMVQMDSGLFSSCEVGKIIPQGLDPPPPQASLPGRLIAAASLGAMHDRKRGPDYIKDLITDGIESVEIEVGATALGFKKVERKGKRPTFEKP